MSRYEESGTDWESQKRCRDLRKTRIDQRVSEAEDEYFKCVDCWKFLDQCMSSDGDPDICANCAQKEEDDEVN
jgi:hypothetical protein